MAGRMGESANVIYDITDDWTLADTIPALRRTAGARAGRAALSARRCSVIVCSQALPFRDEIAPPPDAPAHGPQRCRCRTLSVLEVLNGDPIHLPVLKQAMGVSRCWVIPGRSIRIAWTVKTCLHPWQNAGHGSVVLIGPNHLQGPDMARLGLANLFFTGTVPYARLPELMARV